MQIFRGPLPADVPSTQPHPTTFRFDINGLRAIAVLGVIAFHFKLGPLRAGGYCGVDAFFVISGFLMTQIIAGRLAQSRFALLDFWQARVRRIVPALVALVAAVYVAGLVLLNPFQVVALTQKALSALFFVSNVLFAAEGAYFNAPERNWLLHTWSLSVEWQFYLVFPVLLVALHKLARRRRTDAIVLAAIAVVSFAAMIAGQRFGGDNQVQIFYMLWSRAWEFLAGGLAAYLLPHLRFGQRARRAIHYLGLTALLGSMALIHYNAGPWPSAITAFPVLGTAAVLVADHRSPAWARFPPVRLIGLWSYSIYLVHWPIAAISAGDGYRSLFIRTICAFGSLGLGAISFELVERRATAFVWRSRRRAWATALASTLAFAACLSFTLEPAGLERVKYGRDPALLARLREFRSADGDFLDKSYCDREVYPTPLLRICRFGNPRSDDVLVIGDSFAGVIEPRYQGELTGSQFGVAFLEHGACMPVTDTNYMILGSPCDEWTRQMYGYALASRFKRIVFIALWPTYTRGFLCLMRERNCGLDLSSAGFDKAMDETYARMAGEWRALKAQGKQVVVFGLVPFPAEEESPLYLYERVAAGEKLDGSSFSYQAFLQRYQATRKRIAAAAEAAGVIFVQPEDLCPDDRCPIVRDGHPLYADDAHFRSSMMKDPRFAIYDRYVLPGPAPRPPTVPEGEARRR